MQKVEGSNPFSRFGTPAYAGPLFVGAVDWCVWDIRLLFTGSGS
jgi:hypothetical protein